MAPHSPSATLLASQSSKNKTKNKNNKIQYCSQTNTGMGQTKQNTLIFFVFVSLQVFVLKQYLFLVVLEG